MSSGALGWIHIQFDHFSITNQSNNDLYIAPGYIYTKFGIFSLRIDHIQSEDSLGQERGGRFFNCF